MERLRSGQNRRALADYGAAGMAQERREADGNGEAAAGGKCPGMAGMARLGVSERDVERSGTS